MWNALFPGAQELAVAGIDLARFQRTSKSAHHSTCGRSDYVVQRGGVGSRELGGVDLVVLGDGPVDAEDDGLRLTGQVGNAQRAGFRSMRTLETYTTSDMATSPRTQIGIM